MIKNTQIDGFVRELVIVKRLDTHFLRDKKVGGCFTAGEGASAPGELPGRNVFVRSGA